MPKGGLFGPDPGLEERCQSTMKSMKYLAVIFDLFGTLADNFSTRAYMEALERMAAALSVSFDDLRRAWFETSRERNTGAAQNSRADVESICRNLRVLPDEKQVELAVQIRLDHIRQVMTPRPGATDVLACLREEGHKTGLISDCTHEIPVIWPETLFAPLFDVAIFSCSVGMRKPDPRIYQLAASQLEVRPEQCLYVGDGGSQELSGALQVGMHPVLLRLDADSSEPQLTNREHWDGPSLSSLMDVLALVREEPGS